MSKIVVPDEKWVELYAQLSAYVENKCYFEHEKTQEKFCEIVDEVEEILEVFFIKEGHT
tara:strand:+ start:331 stop:507 length:177 start_codon:yes stop_codon:yes gene_type:complete